MGSLEPLSGFVESLRAAGAPSDEDARSQMFRPTACPEKLTIVPGVTMSQPSSFDYAPDIEAAHGKIKSLAHVAKQGKLAVLNISIEPGSGKTLYLPFKFVESSSLVVLPTVFDAWAAHTTPAAGGVSNIRVFGYSSVRESSVTYTDSYHAAFLLTTGALTEYNMVFVDESHSQEGVTSFMASAYIPGVTFVRMTASPPNTNSRPKKSFSIITEKDTPSYKSPGAVSEYISGRPEERVLVMAPTSDSAILISKSIPGSRLLTSSSSLEDLLDVTSIQTNRAIIVADATCGKAINLNVDLVVDFGYVSTSSGIRRITKSEQLQRKHRVGRNKHGVYSCAYVADDFTPTDDASVFRNNLWCIVNQLPTKSCIYPDVNKARALDLLTSFIEPALVPVDVTPPVSERTTSSASADRDFHDVGDGVQNMTLGATSVDIDDDDEPGAVTDEFDLPDWYIFYVMMQNHPAKYIGDLVHDHRRVAAKAVAVKDGFVVTPATNRLSVESVASGSTTSSDDATVRRGRGNPQLSELRKYSTDSGGTRAICRSKTSSSAKVRYHEPGVMERKYLSVADKLAVTGSPLKLMRSTRNIGTSRGTAYRALSLCGPYAVESGLVLASSAKVCPGLAPLSDKVRKALSTSYADEHINKATHYLTWTVSQETTGLDVSMWALEATRVGAWAVPPSNTLPVIDLESSYHPSWSSVVADRVRDSSILPPMVPRVGLPKRANRRNAVNSSPLEDALDACELPSYTVPEQQMVFRAWNILAMRSADVSGAGTTGLHDDARILLAYMTAADRLSDIQ